MRRPGYIDIDAVRTSGPESTARTITYTLFSAPSRRGFVSLVLRLSVILDA
jgi:hypothetical protein